VGFWDWDIPNNKIYLDFKCAELFDADPDLALLGLPNEAYLKAVHRDDVAKVVAAIKCAMRSGGAFESEYRVVRGGRVRRVYAKGLVTLDHAKKANPISRSHSGHHSAKTWCESDRLQSMIYTINRAPLFRVAAPKKSRLRARPTSLKTPLYPIRSRQRSCCSLTAQTMKLKPRSALGWRHAPRIELSRMHGWAHAVTKSTTLERRA
jgi:hypothetical protein